jgi:DNA-binding Lrp family transcriptional regulator
MTPTEIDDPINQAILNISEDRLSGFSVDPFLEISQQSGIEVETVISRIKAMLQAGVARRVRQTLQAVNLASGALVAWNVPDPLLNEAFDKMMTIDPFTGHIVIRTSPQQAPGSQYRLWTTVKIPTAYSLEEHCEWLKREIGALSFALLPAKRVFTLGVGHIRRQGIEIGERSDAVKTHFEPSPAVLTEDEWSLLEIIKREFSPDEICRDLWSQRAAEAGMSLTKFSDHAKILEAKGVIGRFSTFLEHVKPSEGGLRATGENALFQWAVPKGMEIDAGTEVARHLVMTHVYWREGGEKFGGVNIMGAAHGKSREILLAHLDAINAHLAEQSIIVSFSNVYWGSRSEIKPSEVSPILYNRLRNKQIIRNC